MRLRSQSWRAQKNEIEISTQENAVALKITGNDDDSHDDDSLRRRITFWYSAKAMSLLRLAPTSTSFDAEGGPFPA